MKRINKIITLSLISSTMLFGVESPKVGNIIKEINPPKNIVKDKKELIEIDGVKKVTSPMRDDKSGKTVLVKDFQIEGNSKISSSEILEKISSYKNKELSFSDMQEVATLITKLYRDKGYFVARAYIPMQDMKDGVLKIAVVEGEIGKYNIINNSKVKDSIIQSIFDESKKDKIISTQNLERSILIANDLSGVIVTKANVKPGSQVGSSDFDIETSATNDYSGYIVLDNFGSRYTNKNRAMVGVDINSPFKIGDKLSFVGLQSNAGGLKYLSGAYETLLHPSGLKGGLGYSYTNYKLSDKYANLDAKGYLKDFNVNLSYPIIRQRDRNLYLKFNFDNKRIKDEIRSTNDSSEKEINVATLSLDYSNSEVINSFPTSTTFLASLTRGSLSFDNEADLQNDMAGADTNGAYSKLYFEAFKSISFTPRISLEGTLKYQHALSKKNLDGSEDLSIGGSQGVKVYPTSEASAENGYVATIEAKYLLPNINNYSHTVGIFYDRARAYAANNTNVTGIDIDLQDIGISYYVTYKDFFVNSYMAWKMNSDTITSEPDYNSKFLVQAGWVF
ncbi:ShlB/FhaC/HecB family hemolysin secretion/activation protein [Halarcobacter ebronensis]|uniref:Hemin-binding protein n=1 Tax=Halarcobacter ebronensis TaxID=1462615 RepID=A0A4V1LZQ7_9BACT|nr:POTRA domain-containing protein [Halarcobacter ebronensis]QKF81413.1 hemolysin secretion/activation protein, ShlB/FhaC/HecB family [Halarcobacter ebronensis]RXK01827.1 hemin-binding protein [Halarcobacter ebronensis]